MATEQRRQPRPERGGAGSPGAADQDGANSPPARAAAAAAPVPLAARCRQAKFWSLVIAAVSGFFTYVTFFVIPRPDPAIGFSWRVPGGAGLTLAEAATVLAQAAAMAAALLALQEFGLRRAFAHNPRATTEATFFASSILVRAAFAAVLARHHFGPGGHDAAAAGDGAHRLPMVALFIAAYSTDLWQMISRGAEFSGGYPKMVVPHHWLSLAWFAAWLLLFAPRGTGGAPVFNTAVLYLTCCVPIHAFKLLTCLYRPSWAPLCLVPVLSVHWALLLASQAYYNVQCACSSLGCWYPGSLVMLGGGWGMVVYTLDSRMDSIVHSGSKYFGATISAYDLVPLLLGQEPEEWRARLGLGQRKQQGERPSARRATGPAAADAALLPAPADRLKVAVGAGTESDDEADAASSTPVAVELLLQQGTPVKAAGHALAESDSDSGSEPGRASSDSARRRWLPACAAGFDG